MIAPRFLETLGKDARFGLMQCRRYPGLAATVVLSLAIGIGANTALFGVVNAVMLRGAQVSSPATLVGAGWLQGKQVPDPIMETQSGRGARDGHDRPIGLSFPYPSFSYIRSHVRGLSSVCGFVPFGMLNRASAVVRGEPMFVDGEMVTGDYFATLGVGAAHGRVIVADDDNPAAPRVGVISDRFWARVFGRDLSAIGTTISIGTIPVTIVGIAPSGFVGLETGRAPDIWIPITTQPGLTPWGVRPDTSPEAAFIRPNYWWLQVAGQLNPGISEAQAQAEMTTLLRASFNGIVPDGALNDVPQVELVPASTGFNLLKARFSTSLLVLGVVVGVVLLVACANVATLLLTRAASRRKEMSVRLALGASRGRLIRQLLTEHALYSAGGAVVALILATWGSRILLAWLSAGPDPLPVDVGVDLRVLAFTAGVSILTTILFGVVPAIRATRVEAAVDLKDTSGGSARDIRIGRFRIGRAFVAAQIAMTVPLIIGAGLFLRTLANLEREPLGFNSENMLLFSLDATKAGFKDAALLAAYEDMRLAIESVPGVKSATFSRLSLVSGWTNNGRIVVEGQPAEFVDRKNIAHWNGVGPRFLDTLGIRLLLGRTLDQRDTQGSLRVAVINQTMAKTLFGTDNPIGMRFWQKSGGPENAVTVVGVVADAKYSSVRSAAPPTYYVPYSQMRTPMSGVYFEVRTNGVPLAVVESLRRIGDRVVHGVPLGDVKTQAAQIDQSLSQERMLAALFTFFGVTALALACLGIQGTMAYTLKRRTREIGIRMALGAGRGALVRMVLGETAVIAIAGLAVGGLLAASGTRFVNSLLFGVAALDPATVACGIALMFTVAITAGYIPAHRAARLDPTRALREE